MKQRHFAILLASASLVPTAVHAQDAPPVEETDRAGLEDIVVVAQRRAENLQDVPIAVSAVTASVAEKLGITNPQAISQLVPGFTFTRQAQGAAPFVRGVGNASTAVGNEPSVAIFLDDIYIPSGAAAIFDFNNVELVELLKGPQGTLFGRNATGGVLHVHTREPSLGEFALDANVGYANYDTWSAQAHVNVPVSDAIAFNISAFGTDQRDGWGKSLTGDDVNFNEGWGVRSRVLIQASEDTKILLSGLYNRRKSDQGFALRVVDGYFGRGGYSRETLGIGFYDSASNFSRFYDAQYHQFSARVSHDFDNATLVSTTAYGKLGVPSDIDIDASPVNFINADTNQGAKTFTQEIQLLSASGSNIDWIIGGFFLKDHSFFDATFTGNAFGPLSQRLHAEQKTRSISGFAQAGMEILPRTKMTIGIRYTSDKREAVDAFASLGATTNMPADDSKTFSSLTGRFSLDYQLTDDVMVYAAYNRGFKSGVYNISGITTATARQIPVEPEDINAYTIGFKSEFADRRIRLNAEAFYYDYSNIQIQNNLPSGGGTILVNGGAATIKGVDVDLTVLPVNNLQITASISIADGKYDRFDNGPTFFPLPPNAQIPIPAGCAGVVPTYPTAPAGTPQAQRACSLAGNKTILTVPFQSNVSAIYTIPSNVGEFTLAGSWGMGGKYYFEADNLSFSRQKRTHLINASVAWLAPSEKYDVRLWVNNLTKEQYYSYIANSGSSGTKASVAAPRTYGVTLGVHF